MILFSGALLLTPGFFTDAVGFALLVPAIRAAVFRWLRTRVKVMSFTTSANGPARPGPGPGRRPGHPDVIEGEYEVNTAEPERHHRPD
jgi:UPF0716 protein FxsA